MARRRKGQTPEDKALWDKVAATANPLTPRRELPEPLVSHRPPEVKRVDQAPEPEPIAPFQIGQSGLGSSTAAFLAPSITDHVNAAPVQMHRGTHKKMMRGQLRPEARIDLHGLTLDRAHPRLMQFVQGAHARGLRLVLVITGKGKDRDEDGPIPVRRGVLRHQVPGWLAAPPLASLVLDVRSAHHSHGGEGAYYVYLRRRR